MLKKLSSNFIQCGEAFVKTGAQWSARDNCGTAWNVERGALGSILRTRLKRTHLGPNVTVPAS